MGTGCGCLALGPRDHPPLGEGLLVRSTTEKAGRGKLTVVVLGLLIVMWVAVLAPALLKGRVARRGGGDSVKSFRHQINVIGRTAPATIPAANRRVSRGPDPSGLGVVTPIRPIRQGVNVAGGGPRFRAAPGRVRTGSGPAGLGGQWVGDQRTQGIPVGPMGPVARRGSSRSAPAKLQRRRQVMASLLGSVALTFLVGIVPSMRMLWVATGLFAVLLGGYVCLLVRMRSQAAEREMKLAFLPQRVDPQQAEPAIMLRRSAN